MSEILVRCRGRRELPVDEFRSWLDRRRDAVMTTRFTVVAPDAPEGAIWLLEVDVGDEPPDRVDDLVTDLRLLGLRPAVFVPSS